MYCESINNLYLECAGGGFGENCQFKCNCLNGANCNHVDGSCPQGLCAAGWDLNNCSKECAHGRFGENCLFQCNCLNGTGCNRVHGSCPEGLCEAGWHLNNCSKECAHGRFGENCLFQCNCLNGTGCNRVDGSCPQGLCEAGWQLNNCSKVCTKGTYGMNCSENCSYCKAENCDSIHGGCMNGCKPGWTDSMCRTNCAHGRFGENCLFKCNCLNGTGCNRVDGSCPQGLCDAGWQLNNCSKACSKGRYGSNCVSNCGGCIDDMCEAEFGNCTKYGCKQGFTGHKCAMQDSGRQVEGPAVGSGVGAGLVLLLVIAVFIFFRRRKRRDKNKKGTNCIHSDSSSKVDSEYPLDQCLKNRTCEEKENVNVQKRPHWENPKDGDNIALKHEEQEKINANDSNGCGDVAQYMVSINDLAVAVERKKNYKDFDVEFSMLPMGSQYYSHNEAVKEENKQKNRFLTTFAYDHSRVKLVESVTTDYINANYIKSYSNDRAYIATQGPKKSTLNDFWQMIWQENVGKIVMVTPLKEGEKIKCVQYWPQSSRASLVTGNWILRMTTERKLTVYTYRCLELTHKLVKEVRQIHHFHFTQWPDHGVPDKTKLVYFNRKVKSTQSDLTGPLVVHCSAGIGRTGTYIALDALYDNGQATGFVNVMEFTNMMRKNRMNMIQTVDQYIMVHDALVEAFSVEDTTTPSNTFAETFESKQSKIKDNSKNIFHVEYKKLLAIKAKIDTNKFQAGKIKENIAKNFSQTILPHDDFRPFLMSYGRSRNDYINAVIIPSFLQGKNFITTQFPLKETVGDFWSLVYDHDCRTLVMLEGKSLDLSIFPKNEGQESSFDNFIVSTSSHDQSTNKFILTLRQKEHDADIRNVTMYVTDEWSGCTNISNSEKSVIDFIGMIYNDVGRNKCSVVVSCRDGCTHCGVFVALSLAMEQIEMDKEVDIFQIARRIQSRRPQFVTNAEQYEFCFRCIKEYLRSESVYANM